MLIPLQPSENWDRLNEAYQLKAGYKLENPVKCYQNLYLAVDEVTTQLASFLSHKKAFTWMKGMSPLFDASLPFFLREGFQVQGVDWKVLSQIASPADITAWVQALPTSTLFVLFFEDHAVTGKKTDISLFEKLLAEKKIYFVRASHFSLPSPAEEISPYTIWIGPAHAGEKARALAVCGSRFRAPEKVAPFAPWKLDEEIKVESNLEDPELIKKIENEFEDSKWFTANDNRRFDRVILCFQDLGGDQVLKRLGQHLGLPNGLSREQAQTTHICQWDSIKIFKNWWTPEPSPEQLRGLVVFSINIAQRSDFVSKLKQTLSELRAESQWG
jgi:hypothetical protein